MPDIRRFRLVSVWPNVVEPNGRKLAFRPETFRTVRLSAGGVPLLKDHLSGTGRIAGKVLSAAYDPIRQAIMGDVEIFPDSVSNSARDIRRLIDAGHRGASIRFDNERYERDENTGVRHVHDWEIVHLAVVSEGADPMAGPELSNEYTDVNLVPIDLVPEQEHIDMKPELQGAVHPPDTGIPDQLTAVIPVLQQAVAAGVQAGLQADAEAKAKADAEATAKQADIDRQNELDAREFDLANRALSLDAREAELESSMEPQVPEEAPPAEDGVAGYDPTVIQAMADLMTKQECYLSATDEVLAAAVEAIAERMPANEFMDKVRSSPNTPNTCLLYTSPSPRD